MSASKLEVKGFNAGYKIEKHLPALSAAVRPSLEKLDNEFAVAFVAGSQEMMKERNRSKVFSKLRSTGKNIEAKGNREKGIEPEK